MNKLIVDLGSRSYPISIGQELLKQPALFSDFITGKKVMVVTNEVVAPLYLETCKNSLKAFDIDELILPDGEKFKNLTTFELILNALLANKHSRDTTVVALGGGVIGDMAGFAAACYQRGIAFIQVPTTLLSQVDSSVGGKTAVNHPLGKNMIGAFYQPKAVIIDINCLQTLPKREFAAGMAEVIKYGIIYDQPFFSWLEGHVTEIKAQQAGALTYMIKRCCEIKAEVVALDEKENGIRALLNLGHTFGHAIEAEQGYGNWLHGEAVAAGMMLAAHASLLLDLLNKEQVEQIAQLINAFDLPLTGPDKMTYKQYAEHMLLDKKVLNGKLRLVLPTSIGSSELFENVSEELLRTVIEQ